MGFLDNEFEDEIVVADKLYCWLAERCIGHSSVPFARMSELPQGVRTSWKDNTCTSATNGLKCEDSKRRTGFHCRGVGQLTVLEADAGILV